MSNDLIRQVIRYGIVSILFFCFLTVAGVSLRVAQQLYFSLFVIMLFGVLLKNIWATLFLAWTVFLFIFYKHAIGHIYVQNVFFGCVLYYLTKVSFKKEHIPFFINAVLIVLFLNLMYGIVQVCWLDWVFQGREHIIGGPEIRHLIKECTFNGSLPKGLCPAPMGFMANTNFMATFIALCIPLMMTRGRWSEWLAIVLFIPLFILHCSSALIAGGIGYLFVLFYRVKRRLWFGVVVASMIMGAVFLMKFDTIGVERFSQWRLVLQDAKTHPVVGMGLDSFRKITQDKKYIYATDYRKVGDVEDIQYWDNPHNLYISLLFEWGGVGMLLLIGYIVSCIRKFNRSVITPNLLAVSGFMVSFFIVSMGQFPIFLARLAVIIVPLLALYDVETV